MYHPLADFFARPAPFSRSTIKTLWTDDHISARMLDYHLDPENDVASRRPETIAKIIAWIDDMIGLKGKKVCDLGCGPGLYAQEMAKLGAEVSGLDFSERSLAHARQSTARQGLSITFAAADYLEDELPGGQDIVMLIYGDVCALSPDQRQALYAKIHAMLNPGGHFVFDVFSAPQFADRRETTEFARNFMDGFWSIRDYFGFVKTFLYDDTKLALDRYLIIEEDRTREIYNWLQYFTPEDVAAEMTQAGFKINSIVDAVTGQPWRGNASEFAVVARK